jgi:hypothetical protein
MEINKVINSATIGGPPSNTKSQGQSASIVVNLRGK